jgi:hypothetical protein
MHLRYRAYNYLIFYLIASITTDSYLKIRSNCLTFIKLTLLLLFCSFKKKFYFVFNTKILRLFTHCSDKKWGIDCSKEESLSKNWLVVVLKDGNKWLINKSNAFTQWLTKGDNQCSKLEVKWVEVRRKTAPKRRWPAFTILHNSKDLKFCDK